MKACSIALLLLALVAADNWAVLVAGSDGFWNYRHQADVSHAYQIMRKGGTPADHIINMMSEVKNVSELNIDDLADAYKEYYENNSVNLQQKMNFVIQYLKDNGFVKTN